MGFLCMMYKVQPQIEKRFRKNRLKTATKNIRPEFIPRVLMEARVVIFQKFLEYMGCKVKKGEKCFKNYFNVQKILLNKTVIGKRNKKEISL